MRTPHFKFHMLCQARTKRVILVIIMSVTLLLIFHIFTLPSPKFLAHTSFVPSEDTSTTSLRVGGLTLLSDSRNSHNLNLGTKTTDKDSNEDSDLDDDIDLIEDEDPDTEFSFDLGNGVVSKKGRDPVGGFITLERVAVTDHELNASLDKVSERDDIASMSDGISLPNQNSVLVQTKSVANENNSSQAVNTASVIPSSGGNGANKDEAFVSMQTDSITLERVVVDQELNVSLDKVGERDGIASMSDGIILANQNSALVQTKSVENEYNSSQIVNTASVSPSSGENRTGEDKIFVPIQTNSMALNPIFTGMSIPMSKKKRRTMPAVSVSEMNQLLLHNLASYRSMRPGWSSVHDKEMLDAKAQIENAPIVREERRLYTPLYRNLSTFKRSYELMEKKLKVYVYMEGEKPIFHEPLLRGIYASEGWFMKQMEANRQYVVKNPKEAHLFYVPFSSRQLRHTLSVRNLHSKQGLVQRLTNYVDLIASKYPFWNRTGGADHFLAACHDWAPYETRQSMEHTIRALCLADLREGFLLGNDVSLPTTFVRFPKNPLRDLGGKPANARQILAFFAGNLHGRLRSILLQHWENKNPDMKIMGPMRKGYVQFMKNSKYCICPRGYEANSPRVVESIFFECVPVIISDNYVPPFFEVLNWEAFSVFVLEKDVPDLKKILAAIPEKKYLELQKGVRKVQQHFLWHTKPVKYDLFHMILHSVWFSRVNNVRTK